MKISKLYGKIIKAIEEFKMIDEGDHIAAAISGGKDSLVMLYALADLRKMKNFKLSALLVDLGYDDFNTDKISDLCKELNVDFHRIETNIGSVIFQERKEKNPCSMCAKMRKGALNKKALELGCNKISYGHHRDDFNDTLIMSMFTLGKLKTMEPAFSMSRTGLNLIRPMMYVKESEIIKVAEAMHLPIEKNPCPADGKTAREESKQLILDVKNKFSNSDELLFNIIKENNFFIK